MSEDLPRYEDTIAPSVSSPGSSHIDELAHAKSQLAGVLRKLARALLAERDVILEAQYFDEFARGVSSTAELLAEAHEKWSALSDAAGRPIL
jgi:hypothetical protein